jgi:hypothetical protein
MDWQATVMAPLMAIMLRQLVRTPPEQRDAKLIAATAADIRTKVKILGNYKVKGDAPAPKAERVVQHSPIETDDIPF